MIYLTIATNLSLYIKTKIFVVFYKNHKYKNIYHIQK